LMIGCIVLLLSMVEMGCGTAFEGHVGGQGDGGHSGLAVIGVPLQPGL